MFLFVDDNEGFLFIKKVTTVISVFIETLYKRSKITIEKLFFSKTS